MPQKLSHQGKEKFMGMSKGFAPSQPAEKSEELNKPKPSLSKIYKLAFQIILMTYQTQEWSEPNNTYTNLL
jgi:hypothetical protein